MNKKLDFLTYETYLFVAEQQVLLKQTFRGLDRVSAEKRLSVGGCIY